MIECPLCKRQFKTIQALRSHERKHDRQNLKTRKEGFLCKHCGKIFYKDWRKRIKKTAMSEIPQFCSRSCANSRTRTEEDKEKIARKLMLKNLKEKGFAVNESTPTSKLKQLSSQCSKKTYERWVKKEKYICSVCGEEYENTPQKEVKKKHKGWCPRCAIAATARQNASTRYEMKTSKAERAFRNLCIKEGWKVLHNIPIFNGYDADVILPEYKIAVHWNGPWHYGMIKSYNGYSYEKIHNRDIRKYKEIEKFGYTNYIIKDLSKFSMDYVIKEFEIFKEYLKSVRQK